MSTMLASAEYKTLREACGLSQQAAAAFHNVQPRTVQHWEAGRNNIPPGAAEELALLNARIERAVSEARALAGEHPADVVALVRYRTWSSYVSSRAAADGLPWQCHNALIGRLKLALERSGRTVTISYA